MSIIYRPGVYTWVHIVKFLCRFLTKHQASMDAAFQAVLSSQQYSEYLTFKTAVIALCAIFDSVYPNIKP